MTPEEYAKSGTEFAHQTSLFIWCAMNQKQYPELQSLFAIHNEENSGSAIRGARNKQSGTKKGVADLFLPIPKGQFYGLFIEMKKIGGRASKEQLAFGDSVMIRNYGFVVCQGWESARDMLIAYLEQV